MTLDLRLCVLILDKGLQYNNADVTLFSLRLRVPTD